MSNLNQLVARLITDEELRKRLMANPALEIENLNLSEAEAAALNKMDFAELAQIHMVLEERLSKSFIQLPDIIQDNNPWHTSHSNSTSDPLHTSTGGNAPGHNSYDVDGVHDSTSHSSW